MCITIPLLNNSSLNAMKASAYGVMNTVPPAGTDAMLQLRERARRVMTARCVLDRTVVTSVHCRTRVFLNGSLSLVSDILMLGRKMRCQGAASPLSSATETTRSPRMMNGLEHPGRFGNPLTQKKNIFAWPSFPSMAVQFLVRMVWEAAASDQGSPSSCGLAVVVELHVAHELSCVLWRPSRCEALARKHTTASSSYWDFFGLERVLRKAHWA